jgi:hypothetical protein
VSVTTNLLMANARRALEAGQRVATVPPAPLSHREGVIHARDGLFKPNAAAAGNTEGTPERARECPRVTAVY